MRQLTVWRQRASWGAGLLLALLLFALPHAEFWEDLEQYTQDIRFLARGPRPTQTPIVICAISDDTLDRWQEEPMAFWGSHYGRIISEARRAGVSWIGLDIVPVVDADDFLDTVGAKITPKPDAALEAAVEAAEGHVILSYVRYAKHAPVLPLKRLRSLSQAANALGFLDLPEDTDNVARRALRRAPENHENVPSLIALLADRIRSVPNAAPGAKSRGESAFWINYTGRNYLHISAEQLENLDRLKPEQRHELQGAILLIGMTNSSSSDIYRIPGTRMFVPGVDVLANALATLADGRELQRSSRTLEGCLAAIIALTTMLIIVRLSFARGLIVCLLCSGLWCAFALWAFIRADYLLPVVAPVAAFCLPWPAHHSLRSLLESLQRRRVEGLFGRYVSPQVRDHLLRDTLNLELGGETRLATILFLDIRDFTTYAEQRPAAQVMSELNAFFATIIPLIDRHGGLLHKFTGDGFLAVFGVPVPLPNQAQAAIDAALAICAAVRISNAERVKQGSPPWQIGCGIHTGMVVCGNVGIASRAEFTVIGDAVNLAARLEGLYKAWGSEIVFSQATFERLDTPPATAERLETDIRGRREKVIVYRVRAAEKNEELQ